MTSRLLLAFALALTARAADPFFFVQASDPQFGMYTDDRDFRQETANWEFVISNVNRLRPTFLVVTGDLTNRPNDAAQIAEYKRINEKLDPAIHLYNVPGNHDVRNEPTPDALEAYRRNYGADYYSFREGQIYGIVLNSSLLRVPDRAPAEGAKQEQWLEQELVKARDSGAVAAVFLHHPLFLEKPDEPEQYFNFPLDVRRRVLALLHKYGVRYVFAGHYHRNAGGRDGDLQMVTSGPAGQPLGPDPSGIRVIEMKDGQLADHYLSLGSLPNTWPPPPGKDLSNLPRR